MSNFQFLEPEFKSLAATAKEAEKLTYISPQFALAAAKIQRPNSSLYLGQNGQHPHGRQQCRTWEKVQTTHNRRNSQTHQPFIFDVCLV